MNHDASDDLYTKTWPDYFETQRRDLFWYERLWSVLLRQIERRQEKGFLIEFGSGPGFLLKLADRRGWIARGEEPSEAARNYALSINAACGPVGHWVTLHDAGIATEVLEHVDDPRSTLSVWRACMAVGAHFAISVPNDDNPLQALFGRLLSPRNGDSGGLGGDCSKSQPWVHHTHKHYFNPCSLRRLVESVGFEVVWQRTSFPVELFLILPIPRKWAWKLSRLWPAPPFLWRLNVGRHCLLVARKTR